MPSYYGEHGGFLIAGAIDRYVYVTVIRPFTPGIFLKYSQLEHVEQVEEVNHRIIREALKFFDLKTPQIEITTLADIPAGTGLGSSGSFTTALLKALYAHRKRLVHPHELAELACDIEINRLSEPIGKQDQYIAAYGGLTCFTFEKDGRVEAEPLKVSMDTLFDLEDNLLLFFTGFARERRFYPQRSARAQPPKRCGDDRKSAFCERAWISKQGVSRERMHGRFRRTHARALETQKETVGAA